MLTFALFMPPQMPCRSDFPSSVLCAFYGTFPDASRSNPENSAMAVATATTPADAALFIPINLPTRSMTTPGETPVRVVQQ